jgi:hypothetical protein
MLVRLLLLLGKGHYSPFATFSYRLNFIARTSIFQAVIG